MGRPQRRAGATFGILHSRFHELWSLRMCAWLAMAHEQLDTAVAAAYGWADYTRDTPDKEILKRLLALNLECSVGNRG